jgi:hypothetical protein
MLRLSFETGVSDGWKEFDDLRALTIYGETRDVESRQDPFAMQHFRESPQAAENDQEMLYPIRCGTLVTWDLGAHL